MQAMNGRASPTSATCSNSGSAAMASSTSAGATFSPVDVTRISLIRPRMRTRPFSIAAWSPVRSQPSTNALAVSASRFQYPRITLGPRTCSSSLSPILTSTPSSTLPTVAGSLSSGALHATTGAVSVMP